MADAIIARAGGRPAAELRRAGAASGWRAASFTIALSVTVFTGIGSAAIPVNPLHDPKFPRLAQEARAGQARPPAVAAIPEAPDKEQFETLRHEQLERMRAIDAALEALNQRVREIVGRLQLLGGFLIVLLLGIFFWLLDLSRRIAAPTPRPSVPAEPSRRLP